ncbi:FecCD family ABC transporter permease [Insolitispirillum peregrinum]|uniref:FecCD family ABC transporter permease n=1 Tax=Insolitispirillum peregrinum TaxID=80876 RepID=UPI0036201A2E
MTERRLSLLLLLALLALTGWALTLGTAPLTPSMMVAGLLPDLFPHDDPRLAMVMQEIRLPRVLLGLVVGAALGLAGAALQGLLRNPLAEPSIIGTSSCASLGAVLAFYYGLAADFSLALPLAGISGAALGTLLLLALAGPAASTLTLILTGVALSSMAGALTSLALNLSPSPYAVTEIVMWMMGSLKDRSMDDVLLASPFVLAGCLLLLRAGRGLDALTLGEEAAASLGIALPRLRVQVIAGAALAVGAAVATAGSVGFVGLIIPHLLRPLVGHRPSAVLLPSALGGAALLTAADIAVRLIPARSELMLGVVTAIIGTPFFCTLILKARRQA